MTKKTTITHEVLDAVPENRPDFSDSSPDWAAHKRSAAILRLLWNRKRFISRVTIAGMVLSALVAFLIPKRFESTAQLMPPDQQNSGMAMLAAAAGSAASNLGSAAGSSLGGMAGGLLGIKNSGDLFIGVLRSRTVEDDVINKFDLRRVYWDRYFEDARKELEKKTSISSDRRSGIISIQVTDRNPQRAAAIAQEYVDELNRVVAQVNTSSAHRERVFLEERLVEVKQDLESAEKRFSEFASKNTALDIPAQGKAMIEAAAALEGQLVATQTELGSLKQVYTEQNVRVRTMQARADELQRQLQKMGGKFDDPATATSQDDQSMYPSIRRLPLLGVNYADLYRNTRVEEAIFGSLTQQYELAKVEEAKETPSVKVLDSPAVPEKKSFPPRLLIILLGSVLGFSVALTVVFGAASWQNAHVDDPRKVLALEVIGTMKARFPGVSSNGSGHHPAMDEKF